MYDLLFFLGPILVLVLIAIFWPRASRWLADFKESSERASLVIFIFLWISGGLVAYLIDEIDFSEILFGDQDRKHQQVETLLNDVSVIYLVADDDLAESLKSRIGDLFESPDSSDARPYMVVSGVLLGLCVSLSICDIKSQRSVAQKLNGCLASLKAKSDRLKMVCMGVAKVEQAIKTKLCRLTKLLEDRPAFSGPDEKLAFCREFLDPRAQLHPLARMVYDSIKTFLESRGLEGAYSLRVAIFVPDDDGEHLEVTGSCVGPSDQDLGRIENPNLSEYRDYFRINQSDPNKRTVVVKAFNSHSPKPIIIDNCLGKKDCVHYTECQKERIQFIAQCPLLSDSQTGNSIGVLSIDSNRAGLLGDAEDADQVKVDFIALLAFLREQVDFRLQLEQSYEHFLQLVEGSA